jgi:hypothetical protein
VRAGDYLCDEHDLYRVEHLTGGRVQIEDCRAGDPIDVEVSELRHLQLVEPAPIGAQGGTSPFRSLNGELGRSTGSRAGKAADSTR